MSQPQGYFVEHNGDCWQSVFPETQAHESQLHRTIKDALQYMIEECGLSRDQIKVIRRSP